MYSPTFIMAMRVGVLFLLVPVAFAAGVDSALFVVCAVIGVLAFIGIGRLAKRGPGASR